MALHVILGPMFSGKTTRLISAVERYRVAGRAILIINHSLDMHRSDGQVLQSHDGKTVPAILFDELSAVFEHPTYVASSVIAIDEGQFFPDLLKAVRKMVEQDQKVVYVAGLDGTYLREPFGEILQLIPLCDSVEKLSAVCKDCEVHKENHLHPSSAFFTKALSAHPRETVSIGGAEKYKAVCRRHFLQPQD